MTPSQQVLKREQDKFIFLKRRCSVRNDIHGDYHKNTGTADIVSISTKKSDHKK